MLLMLQSSLFYPSILTCTIYLPGKANGQQITLHICSDLEMNTFAFYFYPASFRFRFPPEEEASWMDAGLNDSYQVRIVQYEYLNALYRT